MIKYILIMMLSAFISSYSQMLLKKSANIKYDNKINEYLNKYVIIGYGLMFLSMILMVFAFKGLDYKTGTVIDSVAYIFVLVLSSIIFKEKITVSKIIGNVLIILGIIVFCI